MLPPLSPVVQAPGKIFLIGEYAVLEGGCAALAAVSRFATAHFVPNLQPSSKLVAEAVAHARLALGSEAAAVPPGSVLADSAAFEEDGRKLGIGSSAAVAVAAVGAVFAYAGRPIETQRALIHSVADAAHRTSQGGLGSGGDIAVAIHGGFLQFRKSADGLPQVLSLQSPADLHMRVLSTGNPITTPNMIERVRAFAERDPGAYAASMDSLRSTANEFLQAFAAGHIQGIIAAADAYGHLMDQLGQSAGVAIVTPALRDAAARARALGGAAKPSGAGGGDVAVAFFSSAQAAAAFCSQRIPGLSVLDLRLGAAGVSNQPASRIERS